MQVTFIHDATDGIGVNGRRQPSRARGAETR